MVGSFDEIYVCRHYVRLASYSMTTMDPRHKEILRKHRLDLSNQILIDDTIVQFLYQENILTESQVDEIQSQIGNKKKTLRLLDILPTRGPRAFGTFLNSLEEEFPWVRDELLQNLEQPNVPGQSPTDEWSIPEVTLRAVPSDRQLSRLASRLGSEWESVLLDLGLSTGALYRCRADHPLSLHGQVLAGLIQWRQRQGRSATVHRLLQSLQSTDVHPSTLDEVFQ
ncbi:death domain-containing protein CRADD isoform X1 [Salvelinus sp. IW2-2015]|uniref:death domain-containing protein CRADD isoform X1 n=1 Tax=Salvelinus sp. IW2-2015 TaxID=2691554 RepID=UPI000CEB3590|nr:death domain-containing protein CRADD-like isoform X1 [Salvelinus alpinus]